MKMQLNHSTDITFSEYVKQLQNKCTTDVNSVQYCILQYMILEQEELLIRFVNELYKYDKKKQQKDRNNNNNKNIITIQKKKLWGDYDDNDDNYWTNAFCLCVCSFAVTKFTVYADFPPKFDGPDVVYFEKDESYPTSFKNAEYVSLTMVYLRNTSYPVLNTNSNDIVFRPLQLIQKLLKLTLTLYTDLSHSCLYQKNGKIWYADLIINRKV